MIKSWEKVEFNVKGDERGSLVALESQENVPFEIKRVYYIYENQKGLTRGQHAHKNLKQLIICLSGRCTVLVDNGSSSEQVTLDTPSQGLFVNQKVWREITKMSPGAVIAVLANRHYEKDDYIHSYKQFKKYLEP